MLTGGHQCRRNRSPKGLLSFTAKGVTGKCRGVRSERDVPSSSSDQRLRVDFPKEGAWFPSLMLVDSVRMVFSKVLARFREFSSLWELLVET